MHVEDRIGPIGLYRTCSFLSNQLPALELRGGTLNLVLRCLLTNPRE
jgi:hypothetical protein